MFKKISAYEVFLIILFLALWVTPVASASILSLMGYKFSFAGQEWQLINQEIVIRSTITALAGAAVSVFLIFSLAPQEARKIRGPSEHDPFNKIQKITLILILTLSGYGTIQSFGGTIFDKPYSGPSTAWLGYGAWSVTYLFTLGLLLFDHMHSRQMRFSILLMITIAFLPYLLSGSRIDFLSFMLGFSVYISSRPEFKHRFTWGVAISIWAILVVFPVAYLRSIVYSLEFGQFSGNDLALQIMSRVGPSISDDMIYLSTIGDVGASVFQVVGHIEAGMEHVGIGVAAISYAIRMLPGPIFSNRPTDFRNSLPDNVGGGSLHSLGEGYLMSGYLGCAVIGAFMGLLISLAILSKRTQNKALMQFSGVLFVFPWLLLIRGSWYQFFSILKSLEVLVFLIFLLYVAKLAERKDLR